MATAATGKRKQLYGIAEWYGKLFRALSDSERKELVGHKLGAFPCPYLHQVPTLGPKSGKLDCNKVGGVCSLRNFHDPSGDEELSFGDITATCPNRFLEHGTIVSHIGKAVLMTDKPLFAKEIAFLKRPKSRAAGQAVAETEAEQLFSPDEGVKDAGKEDVGRIDLVFVDPDDTDNWCAVEMQAVYFSGGAMSEDMKAIKAYNGNGIPMPGAARRPDFRSSGPKRLMPQLMIKVPTLRRWGKKMVVVIDRPFLDAMDDMDRVADISNCDIVWVVVAFEQSESAEEAVLAIHDTIFTTLEDAVKGLTAGEPTTLSEFESKLSARAKPTFPVSAGDETNVHDVAPETSLK